MLKKTYRLMQQTRALLTGGGESAGDNVVFLGARAGAQDLVAAPQDLWPGDPSRGHDLMACVEKMNDDALAVMVSPQGLMDVDLSFHAFEWLADLKAVGSHEARAVAARLILAWMDQNRLTHRAIGGAELSAARMMRILGHYSFYAPGMRGADRARVCGMIVEQMRVWRRGPLPRSYEALEQLYVSAAGLAAQIALHGSVGSDLFWIRRLEQAMNIVILVDGGPMTRRASDLPPLLRLCLDLRHTYEASAIPVPSMLAHAIDRVVPALQFFQMGDGMLSAFHGGVVGDRARIRQYLKQARVNMAVPATLPYTGFERLQGGDTVMIVDAGPAGLAHHASTTAFELSVGAERVVVNCGQHGSDPAWRDLLAATSAHSTLALDHQDNRVPEQTSDVEITRADSDMGPWLEITHNGYRTRNGFMHTRRLWVHEDGTSVEGEDHVTTAVPPLEAMPCILRFHLHPRIRAVLEGARVVLTFADGTRWIFEGGGGDVCLEESVYLAGTGRPVKTQQIVLSKNIASARHEFKWVFRGV